jgi:hypothetical protein
MADIEDQTVKENDCAQLNEDGVVNQVADRPLEITEQLSSENSEPPLNAGQSISNQEPEIISEVIDESREIVIESIAVLERPSEIQDESIVISERPVEVQNESIPLSEQPFDAIEREIQISGTLVERQVPNTERPVIETAGPLLLFNNEGISDVTSDVQSRSDSGNVIKNKVLKQAKKIRSLDSPKSKRIHDSITKVFGNDDPPPGFGRLNPKYYYLEQKRPQPIQPLKVCTFPLSLKTKSTAIFPTSGLARLQWQHLF